VPTPLRLGAGARSTKDAPIPYKVGIKSPLSTQRADNPTQLDMKIVSRIPFAPAAILTYLMLSNPTFTSAQDGSLTSYCGLDPGQSQTCDPTGSVSCCGAIGDAGCCDATTFISCTPDTENPDFGVVEVTACASGQQCVNFESTPRCQDED
jgi:hypothetical protein